MTEIQPSHDSPDRPQLALESLLVELLNSHMAMNIGRFTRWSILGLCFCLSTWWVASNYYEKNWGWPLAMAFGAVFSAVFIYLVRRSAGKPAPFQLVLRLADDKGGDQEDDQTFETLHARFKQHFPKSGSVRFDGFDTDGSFIWFYFFGPDESTVRGAVLPPLEGCQIRQGSYFLSKATQRAAPNDGPATLLGDSRITEAPSSVS